MDLAAVIERESSRWDLGHTTDIRMIQEVLIPSTKSWDGPDLCAEMFGVEGNRKGNSALSSSRALAEKTERG
jgi:hypothetical protein